MAYTFRPTFRARFLKERYQLGALLTILSPFLITPAAGSAASSRSDPTFLYSSVSLTPVAISAASDKANPAVVLGSLNVTPAQQSSTTTRIDPLFIYGSILMTPAPQSAASSKVNPTLWFSSGSITPSAASATSSRNGPTLYMSSVSFTPALGSARSTKADPIVDFKVWRATWASKGPGFVVGDIVMTQRADFDATGTKVLVLRAFGEVVEIGIDATGKEYSNIYVISGQDYFDDPGIANTDIEWVVIGNKIDAARAALIYMTADEDFSPRIELRSGVDSYTKFGDISTLRVALGNLGGITDANFGVLTGYGLLTDNAYLKSNLALGSATGLIAGVGVWATKTGDFRVGDPATGKTLTFKVSDGSFVFGANVTLSWGAVDGRPTSLSALDSGAASKLSTIEWSATLGAAWGSNVTGRPTNLVSLGDIPGYIQSTYISSTEVRAPNITGNSILGGNIVASSGSSNTAGLTGESSGDTAIRIWAGDTYANRATAPFRVTQGGSVVMTNAQVKTGSSGARVEIGNPEFGSGFINWISSNGLTSTGTMRTDHTLEIVIDSTADSAMEVWCNLHKSLWTYTIGGYGGVGVVRSDQFYAEQKLIVNGLQVISARGAAIADATDAASVILRLNDLLARLRTHGLIAT